MLGLPITARQAWRAPRWSRSASCCSCPSSPGRATRCGVWRGASCPDSRSRGDRAHAQARARALVLGNCALAKRVRRAVRAADRALARWPRRAGERERARQGPAARRLLHGARAHAVHREPRAAARVDRGRVRGLEPVYGIALALWLLGEVPDGRTIAGATLLVVAAMRRVAPHDAAGTRRRRDAVASRCAMTIDIGFVGCALPSTGGASLARSGHARGVVDRRRRRTHAGRARSRRVPNAVALARALVAPRIVGSTCRPGLPPSSRSRMCGRSLRRATSSSMPAAATAGRRPPPRGGARLGGHSLRRLQRSLAGRRRCTRALPRRRGRGDSHRRAVRRSDRRVLADGATADPPGAGTMAARIGELRTKTRRDPGPDGRVRQRQDDRRRGARPPRSGGRSSTPTIFIRPPTSRRWPRASR